MTRRERMERRAERRRQWAEGRAKKANERSQAASSAVKMIPFGQPILVGHHSEGAHRRALDRCHNAMSKAVEHGKMAELHTERADNIESALERSVFTDDPDAPERLRERIADLDRQRQAIVAFNKTCRRGVPDLSLLDAHWQTEHHQLGRINFLRKDGSFPPYATTNLGGRINTDRKRLEQIERARAREEASAGTEPE